MNWNALKKNKTNKKKSSGIYWKNINYHLQNINYNFDFFAQWFLRLFVFRVSLIFGLFHLCLHSLNFLKPGVLL